MVSPFRKHQQAVRAAMSAKVESAGTAPDFDLSSPEASEYQQLLASLHNDLRTLHDIQSVQGKIEAKRAMISAYLPWVEGALAAGADGRAVQDEIVVMMLVWALDVQDWALALGIACHVLDHGLTLPERYKRTPACLIAEEIADAAKVDLAAVPQDFLLKVAALVTGRDMPDQVRAKLHRAIGLGWAAQADTFDPAAETAFAGGKPALIDAALIALAEARRLDSKVGVAKKIEELTRAQRKLAEAASSGTGSGTE